MRKTPLEVRAWALGDQPGTWLLHFPYLKNPIPANGGHGGHWGQRAQWIRRIRETTAILARYAGIPELDRVSVQLTWWVKDHRTRDADNLAPLEKPMFDGLATARRDLASARIVPDDSPRHMEKPRAQILVIRDHPNAPVTEPGFVLTITALAYPDEL
jgi:hypothetical protein